MKNLAKDRESIIQSIETTFLYLGCANIRTDAMDGAIPLNAVATSCREHTIGMLDVNPYVSKMPTGWMIKTVHIENDKLVLMTAADVHWTVFSHIFGKAVASMRRVGSKVKMPDYDCYSELYYSEIDSNGKFAKFPVGNWRREGLIVKRLYNPNLLFGYADDNMVLFDRDNHDRNLAKQIRAMDANTLLVSMANTLRMQWTAKVKIEDTLPGLTLITDPTGIKELWKLRDIPEGKKRRDALLHWVDSHWRQNRFDPDVESYVRKHLRGQTQFTHGSLRVEIKASETDLVDAEIAKQDRERLRKTKEDRRARVKVLKAKLAAR